MKSLRSPRAIAVAAVAATAAAALVAAALVGTAPSASAFSATSKATVINYLRTLSASGSGTISGQHNKEPASNPRQYTQAAINITGQTPGLWGGDMMFTAADIANRQSVINEAKAQWAAGSLVALTWHACSPTVGASCNFSGGVNLQISAAQFNEIVTPGTGLFNTWQSRMAAVVPFLRQLKDAGVPVLWRPFHEMNESWNWWGARSGTNGGAKIFTQMRQYFDSQGLDNLIWVWNIQDNPSGGLANYYPGSNIVDVVTIDAWYKSYPSSGEYNTMLSIAGGQADRDRRDGRRPERVAADQPAEVGLLDDLVRAAAGQQLERRDPGRLLPPAHPQPRRDQLR